MTRTPARADAGKRFEGIFIRAGKADLKIEDLSAESHGRRLERSKSGSSRTAGGGFGSVHIFAESPQPRAAESAAYSIAVRISIQAGSAATQRSVVKATAVVANRTSAW